MPPSTGYPIEDFLEAITAQLDQTQDALRLKAVNRPLTFALKDFNVDLKVFVEMDAQGKVNFRPAGPNEDGASTVSIGFTTITRPMIEENTISMEMAQAPTLDELGLEREEQRQLAKIGVRNAAQLKNLQKNAGEDTLSRHTGVDLGRIRGALNLARPRIEDISTDQVRPQFEPPQNINPRPDFVPNSTPPLHSKVPGGDNLADRLRQGLVARDVPAQPAPAKGRKPRRLPLDPGAKNIKIAGKNLLEAGRTPMAQLDGRSLDLTEASPSSVTFALPPGQGGGRLMVELPDGEIEEFDLYEAPTFGGQP